jgi:4-hydroxybenzoate polyprenyltransferase/phosphoglycolate phosphatase-like HAD superfamily hydrolase
MPSIPPSLVVDLDGTLIRSDSLLESMIRAVRNDPLDAIRMPLWLLGGRAAFKARLANRTSFSPAHLPYHEELLSYIRSQRHLGRRIVLATAADSRVAEAIAAHLGVFDDVLSSDGTRNLKGSIKLAAIRERVGRNFVYAGDSAADLPIWKGAEGAILVGVSPSLAQAVRRDTNIERAFPKPPASTASWLRALRLHQWLKNLLIFVPLLTSFGFTDMSSVIAAGLAFFAFSIIASGTYLINDLADLENDRAHPRKRERPLASAQISVAMAVAASLVLLGIGFSLAAAITPSFLAVVAVYLAVTMGYTWVLKGYVLVDVLTLAALYTLRIIAGALAIQVALSTWLLAFSVFVFLSLALIKRCSELVLLQQSGASASRGRDYRVSDLVVLWPLGIGAALCSVVVFGIFLSTLGTPARYASPQLLWLVGFGLIYWLARLWIKTARGEMHDDPLVFALRDFGSRTSILVMVGTTIAAHFLRLSAS